MGKLKLWSPEEDHILIATSTLAVSKKWKKAADELKRRGFDRSDIQCRERYINHLDPSVSKGSWSDAQLDILYSKFNEYGHKWFLLQKHLPGRTQTKIKNYFYGNIRFLLKTIIKTVLNVKAGFIDDVKTEILLDIYEGKNNFEGIHLVDKTIRMLNYKIDKKNCEKLIEQHKEVFRTFAKEYLLPNLESNNKEGEQEKEGSKAEESKAGKDEEVRKVVRVEVMSSVGVMNEGQTELQYLEKMSKFHLKQHLYYQKAIQDLMSQRERTIQDRQ